MSLIRNAVLLGGMAVVLGSLWMPPAAPAGSSHALTVRGSVERRPDTPGAQGEWTIGGRKVVVGPQTRLEDHGARAVREAAAALGPGRAVKAKVRPAADGALHAIEIEPEDPARDYHADR